MNHHTGGLSTGTYVLLSITLLLSLAMLRFVYLNVFEPGIRTLPPKPVEQIAPATDDEQPAADINKENSETVRSPGSSLDATLEFETKPAADTNKASNEQAKPLQTSLDGIVEFEEPPAFAGEESEPLDELQQLLKHHEEPHVHYSGKIMVDDDASIKHPSFHDIEGAEVDVIIDFE